MLLKPYNQIDKDKKDPYSLEYTGMVVENNDPDKLKRLKVNIDVWDYMVDDQLPWVLPEGKLGNSANNDSQNIPEIGSEVTVYFRNNDPNDPRYKGAEITQATKCSLFDEDYPNTTGEKDSAGNFTMHNKRTGISVFHHNSGTEIQMDPDGSYTITGKCGCTARCDAEGNFTFKGTSMKIVADEEINLQSERIKLQANNGLDIIAGTVDVNGNTKVSLTSPDVQFNGPKATFNNNIVTINNQLCVVKGGDYQLIDFVGKSLLMFNNGILTNVFRTS